MSWSFRIGMQVVCIYDFTDDPTHLAAKQQGLPCPIPELNKVYVINGIRAGRPGEKCSLWLGLEGLSIDWGTGIVMYGSEAFRPLTENTTDISVFTEILDRVNKPELVSA